MTEIVRSLESTLKTGRRTPQPSKIISTSLSNWRGFWRSVEKRMLLATRSKILYLLSESGTT